MNDSECGMEAASLSYLMAVGPEKVGYVMKYVSKSRPLTIETQHLSDLFLPAFRQDQAAFEELEKLCGRALEDGAEPRYLALLRAKVHCLIQRDMSVDLIRERGGLLHCVVQP